MAINSTGQSSAPAPVGSAQAAASDWRTPMISDFTLCVNSLNDQIGNSSIADPMWQSLHDQRQQYWTAIQALQGSAIDSLLATVPNIDTELNGAAATAKQAVAKIQSISNAVGLAASLLVLATAIATMASTGNPGGIVSAAQGVVTAATKILQQ